MKKKNQNRLKWRELMNLNIILKKIHQMQQEVVKKQKMLIEKKSERLRLSRDIKRIANRIKTPNVY